MAVQSPTSQAPNGRAAAAAAARGPRRRRSRLRGRETAAGWLFSAPAMLMIVVFLVVPILMAAWVSVSDWSGIGNPFSGSAHYVGADNYSALLTQAGLPAQEFGAEPDEQLLLRAARRAAADVLALFLALSWSTAGGWPGAASSAPPTTSRRSPARWPSRSSSCSCSPAPASSTRLLGDLGVQRPELVRRPERPAAHCCSACFGVHHPPGVLANHGFLGLSWWDWLSGPSIAMTAIIIAGHLDHLRHVHADVPGRTAEHPGRRSRRRRSWTARTPGSGCAGSPCRCSPRRCSWC